MNDLPFSGTFVKTFVSIPSQKLGKFEQHEYLQQLGSSVRRLSC